MDAVNMGTTDLPLSTTEDWNYANSSVSHVNLEDLKMDLNMVWLLFSLTSSISWVIYISFYHSRVLGYFLTKLINRLYFRGAFFKIGSLNFNPLAGKIMFRDVVYINFDYTVRVQDGYMIFRWWRSYVPRDVSEDLSHSDTRLSVMLNGLEVHTYNRSDVYAKMEKVFGLKPTMLIPNGSADGDGNGGLSPEDLVKMRETMTNEENERQTALASEKLKKKRPEAMTATTWRDLIPVIKVDITSGRFVFGNSIVPTTLSICVEEAHCVYSTKPAVSRLDHFMHFVKAKAENTKVILAPSPKYTGLVDEPPRFMGEGFGVMMSNLLELYFYMDEPGIVPDEPVLFTLANGDIVEAAPPIWGIDIKCGKGTDFFYGPWADRQRDHLFKFFFPTDYQTQLVTAQPKPGDMRQYQSFDVSLSTLDKATIDILFSKNKETSAVHIITGPGSYLEVTLPWVTLGDGFTTKVTGQLLHVEATTSLKFRSLAECETLQYNFKVHYPLEWNEHQDWSINLTGSKATAYIVYSHIDFFQDLIEDWASKQRPDILSFVPYTCRFSILLKEFEIITTSNEYNWIDCSSTNQENHHLAFCGDLFDLSFNLPFDDYLPMTIPLKFWIHGEGLDLSMYIPEVSSSRAILFGIDRNARILTRDGQIRKREDLLSKKWRRVCQRTTGWVDCWTVPIVALAIQYIYHPMPPLGPDPQADITTPEKEEILLSPMRMPKHRKSPVNGWRNKSLPPPKFDPTTLTPDKVTVEIEIGSSILFAYGNILRNFIHLKENIFGEDQTFVDLESSNVKANAGIVSSQGGGGGSKVKTGPNNAETLAKSISELSSASDDNQKRFDARYYRPFEVTVLLTIHDIQAHLMKNCNDNDPPCPIVLIERLGFEMVKSFTETQLQVLVSPCFLISHDTMVRAQRDKHLKQGHLMLSALQVRGHAMFSNEGRALDDDTLEYAWMLEIQLGKLSGKLTLPQLCHVVTGLETLILLTVDAENELRSPKTIRYCHHGAATNLCPHTKEEARYRCPSSEDIKYRMTRVAIDAVDVYLIENGTALHTWISPVRLSTCNLHGQQVKSGVTVLVSTILLRSFMLYDGHYGHYMGTSHSNTNTGGSGRSGKVSGGAGKLDGSWERNKEDLNLLFQNDESKQMKSKRESDYVLPRRESKERDENYVTRKSGDPSESGNGKRYREDMHSSFNHGRDYDHNDQWLEVGSVSLGSIIVEAATALPIPEHHLHLVQHNFLKLHDEKSKRLWFLWMTSVVEHSRCGCVGGCSFFGSNRNGLKFFKPSVQDLHDNVNIAKYYIHPSAKEFGFGESLLHDGQLVFHTPPYNAQKITLQECNEYVARAHIRTLPRQSAKVSENKSPAPISKFDLIRSGETTPNGLLRTPCSERSEKKLTSSMKERDSPQSIDRRGRRFSYTTQTRPNVHDVPYSRLLDTPSKGKNIRETLSSCDNGSKQPSAAQRSMDRDCHLNRGLLLSPPKTSVSDSRLTVDYFQEDETVESLSGANQEMSSSAPQSHVLESDGDIHMIHTAVGYPDVSSDVNELSVQRTVSLTSENPSEAFFSADEDLHASQTSSGRLPPAVMQNTKKRFASDMSIGGQGDIDARLSSHRSDYEINTPEHRSLPKRPQSTADMPLDSQDSSGNSPSLSSTSFISALSSQEDITLVNLHMQVNKPIVDSPLLMASYVSHLGQLKCSNWTHCSLPYGADAFSTPLFQMNDDGGMTYIGSKMLPQFESVQTWREIRVVSRNDFGPFSVGGSQSGMGQATSTSTNAATCSSLPRSHPWDPNVIIKGGVDKNKKKGDEDEFLISTSESITRNSIIVRCKGTTDIFITPLLLEGLQRLIESITPTLATLHPLTIINSFYQGCISKVQSDNILKRDQSLSYWSQVHSNSKRSTTERNLQGPGGSVLTDVYEESISTQFQGLVMLPKLNVTMIQSSVIEEIISFTALDNVQDLSCASLLVVSFDSIVTRFHLAKTTKASMHTVYTQPTVQSGNLKKGGIFRGTTRALWANISSQSRPDNIPGEPVLIETSEKQLEELVVTLDIGKSHAQLRRLRNGNMIVPQDQIIITSIPSHQSKAMFEINRSPDDTDKHIGYIMFECGLEGVGLKIVKRSHFEKSENASQNQTDTKVMGKVEKKTTESVNTSPLLTERNTAEEGGRGISSKIGIKLPVTPKLSLSKDKAAPPTLDSHKATSSIPSAAALKEEVIINVDSGTDPEESSSKPTNAVPTTTTTNKDNGKTSSALIELKTVWFNFAAPPHVPITRKIDYSRMDWNLLSTASPAITAWLNPSNRFAIKVVAMLRTMHQRRTAVAACLMADALEVQGVHRSVKSRYMGKLTPLSKTLQEDPSCQLCTIMQKYVQKETVRKIENILRSQSELPPLITLRQGVIVLSRQWKNTLYNPMLFEHQYKNKLQPMNVAYAMPQYDEDYDDNDVDTEPYPVANMMNNPHHHHHHRLIINGGKNDDREETERLLGQNNHSLAPHHHHHQHQRSVIKLPEEMPEGAFMESIGTSSPSVKSSGRRNMANKRSLGRSHASTPMFPLISSFGGDKDEPAKIEYGTLLDGSLPSIYSSSDSLDKTMSPLYNPKEDLYSWMAKQQQTEQVNSANNANAKVKDGGYKLTPPTDANAKMEGGPNAILNNCIRDSNSNRLLDAHLIFEPLLSSLGVMPQQMVNNTNTAEGSLDRLGTNLSLVGSFDTLRIDIVVSESSEKRPRPNKGVKKVNGGNKFNLKMHTETPAFLCERVGLDIEVLKVADGLVDGNKPNVLYISRGLLKKHTNTVINFSLNMRYISQQVNMPLLRLLHQISNMYQNVKQAHLELREHPEFAVGKQKPPLLKEESSIASENLMMNDSITLVDETESGHQLSARPAPSQMDVEEHYDKFNEFFPIGNSVSRTKMPTLGPLIPLTPSPSSKLRPQSFAQKLRSTGKTVKGKLGYTNLSETVTTPVKGSPISGTVFELPPTIPIRKNTMESKNSSGTVDFITGPSVNEAFADYAGNRSSMGSGVNPIKPQGQFNMDTPKCWKTIYHLLDLYAQMPDTKTVTRRVSMSPDGDHMKFTSSTKKSTTASQRAVDDEDIGLSETPLPTNMEPGVAAIAQERTRFMVFGVVKIHRTRLLATLSGLKLEAEITALQSSATWRKKLRPVSMECSVTGHVGRAMIVLLEGMSPNQQTVVKVSIGKSQSLYSSMTCRGKDKNSGLLSIGPINIDIPQHPVALHGMMTRSSKQLSSTLQELRVTRTSSRLSKQNEDLESPHHNLRDSSRSGDGRESLGTKVQPTQSQCESQEPQRTVVSMPSSGSIQLQANNALLQPLVMQFNVVLQSLSVQAALLPSLQAQYKMDNVTSTGFTGNKAKFIIDLPSHSLSFTTKIQHGADANLPAEALIALPQIHVSAEYVTENARPQDIPIDGVVLRQGGYVSARADIGSFVRCLTTDLLNHLVFVQKVFMKEINEVVQKVYGGEKPVPLWLDDSGETVASAGVAGTQMKRILFSLNIRMKRIQLTATTPCSSAVRFETGQLELHLSNLVKNVADNSSTKLFGKAQIDLNISLGQLIKNVIFDEAEPEFKQYAFFNTTIGLRNAFQEELLNEDKELVLINLKRPLIYVQPVAVDKAILVWLNYKNAYEYWAEKRANLNKEIISATQQVYEKLPFGQFGQHLGVGQSLSTLFLQLTVEDMGICLPLNPLPLQSTATWPRSQEYESRGAVVITLENTIISACNSGSLVSKGKFVGLCWRFADDFETSLDDWKPNMADASIMNLCVVSEGTYEVCSRTIAAKQHENAKWFLNVKWQMEGVDIHLDVNIGKQLSALGHTLTMLTGLDEDEDAATIDSMDSDDGEVMDCDDDEKRISRMKRRFLESVPPFVFDTTIDAKKRSLMMEKEMSEQLKVINDLRALGATQNTIAQEERRLQELQAVCYKYFRRDMIQKWKRPTTGRSMLRPTNRSQSFIISSPTGQNFGEAEQEMVLHEDEDNNHSQESSPKSGPSRSTSLKIRVPTRSYQQQHRVAFNETMRQSSLPSADCEQVGTFSSHRMLSEEQCWPPIYNSSGVDMHLLDIDGEPVELRRKSVNQSSGYNVSVKQSEPSIDFELDIKVFVNSGKCVLHTKEATDEKSTARSANYDSHLSNNISGTSVKQHKRERSTGTIDFGSPVPTRRNKEKPRLRLNNALLTELTIFHIPGLDVKLHYDSKTIVLDEMSPRMSIIDGGVGGGMAWMRRQGTKRASLFACVTLQSIPEETIISPHILEFLEQTLEPIPSKPLMATSNPVNIELFHQNYVAYASFPVDVIVYFHMQPSTFRFSCLPVSRVECMLKLPSLDIVFSSKRQDEVSLNDHGTDNGKSGGGLSVTGCLADFNVYIFHPYGGKKATGIKDTNRFAPLSDSERKDSLSVNVEFVKFHINRSRTVNFDAMAKKSDQRAMIRFSTIVDIGSASFKYDMRRLTEILAFPKAWYRHSIVRRLFLGDLNMPLMNVGETTEAASSMHENHTTSATAATGVHKTDHGTATIKVTPPEVRGGRGPIINSHRSSKSNSVDSTESVQVSELNQKITAWETLVLFAINFTRLNVQMNMGNVMGNVVWLTKAFQSDGRLSIGSTGYKNMHIGIALGSSALDAKGGIVGGTIELSRINTQFSVREESGYEPSHTVGIKLMALELRLDYMGTSVLMTRISALNARVRDEWKNSAGELLGQDLARRPTIILIHSDLTWDQLQMMISKSTTADLLKMYFKLEEFFSQQFKSSKRVFTSLELKGRQQQNANTNSMKRRKPKVRLQSVPSTEDSVSAEDNCMDQQLDEISAHRHWQKPLNKIQGLFLTTLGVPLTNRDTILGGTMELSGKHISLACFHGINFKSKSWALFSLKDPCINYATEAQLVGESADVNVIQTLTFGLGVGPATNPTAAPTNRGRFFNGGPKSNSSPFQSAPQQNNHSMATVCRLSRNIIFPPQFKTLHEWFHYAFANSEIDCVDQFPVLEREKICEMNTNSIERIRNASANTSSAPSGTPPVHPKLQDPNHTREVIFALPSLQLHFKTDHYQCGDGSISDTAKMHLNEDGKPIVECSFITEFEDHIFVAVDADAFFFLHDLITSYLKEKEKVMNNLSAAASATSGFSGGSQRSSLGSGKQADVLKMADGASSGINQVDAVEMGDQRGPTTTTTGQMHEIHISKDDIVQAINEKLVTDKGKTTTAKDVAGAELESFMKDWRDFKCKTWHLEPTVRLLSWAAKSIEPYGIDYILNKLGFSHARTTIPKWMQRGFMDPLDKLQTLLMLQLISMVREDQH